MPALSHLGYVSLVQETTWATNPGSGYESVAAASEAFKVQQAYEFVKAIQFSRTGHRKVPMGIKASGPLVFEANVEEGLGILLKHTLPSEVTVDNGSGNGGDHTFTPGNTLPAGISFLVNRDTTPSATNIWQFVGGRVKKLKLEAKENSTMKVSADIDFKTGTASAAAATPTYSTENPLVYHTGSFTVDGTPVAIKAFNLDIETGLKTGRGQIGSKFAQQQQPGLYTVKGDIECYFDDMNQVNKYLNGADGALVLTLTGSAVGTSTRKVVITIPTCQYTGETPNLTGPDAEIMLKLPFTAYQSGSGSPDQLVSILMTNSKRTAY